MMESLLTCSNVNRSGSGEGILLASLCKSSGMTMNEFGSICQVIGRDGSSLKTQDVQNQFWGLVQNDVKITKETREKFISAHNGVSKFGMSLLEKKKTPQEIREYVMSKYGAKKDE